MDIFKNAYNRKNFRNLINNIFQKSDIFLNIPENQDVLDDKIESGCLLGELELDGKDFAIFEYRVKDELDLEKNKVGLSKRLIKNGKDYLFDAFLGVYYNEKTNIWRLSLVNIEYTENKEKTTSLKRYTYLLGKDIPVNTAIKQIKNELIDKKVNSIDDLLKAFSVEPVTKEFFERYKKIFEEFNKHSYKNHINFDLFRDGDTNTREKKIRDFNKKLLGRLVFLMFLQKKGWLNSSSLDYKDGDKNFLSNFYRKAIKEDKLFYNEYLEPLFYDTLNKRRENDIFSITGKKVPFLNGGLFEKEVNEAHLSYPNELFDLLFNNENGLFNQYNFTIIENDSTDQEVAVDPEMLGHIFENLLEDNKDKGAFYTPKEIVDYMSKSSLLEYLKTGFEENKENLEENEKDILRELVFSPEIADFRVHFIENNRDLLNMLLDNVKILDPAIGSGAFPMGMLQAIIRVKEVLNHDLNRGEAKRNIIENSIYGVDIESGAVDIARLRFWLSLVVDENKPSPLPNLDFKIVVGNSLVSVLKIGKLEEVIDLSALRNNNVKLDSSMLKKLLDAKNDFYEGIGDKKVLKEKIKDYERDILKVIFKYKIMELQSKDKKHCTKNFSGKVKNHKKCEEYKTKLAGLNKTLDDIKTKDYSIFDYYLNFNEVFQENNGFDIVIGNPPYIKEATNRAAFDGFRETSPYYIGKMDLWYGFTCIGMDLLKDNGVLSFIATNNWITSYGAKKLRNKVLIDGKILEFIDFGDFKVFETASIQTMIVSIMKTSNNNKYLTQYSKIINKKIEKKKIINFLNKENLNDFNIFTAEIVRKDLKNKNIVFLEKMISNILTKIRFNKNFNLDEKLEIASGIDILQDFVNKSSKKKLNKDNILIGDGIFTISDKEKNDLNFNDIELKIIKPLYTTNEVDKYYANASNNFWVIYTSSKFKNINEIKPYPSIKKHLDKFQEIITSVNKPYGLHRARNEFFFKGEKILAIRKSTKYPRFSYINFDSYINRTFIIIKSDRINLKYLTALLNSKLIAFWLRYKGKMQGDNYQLDKEPLLNIPIKKTPTIPPFENLVNKIMALKKEEKDTQVLEDKIDLMVYKLYDLNYDEIKIIDADFDVVLNQFGINKVKYESMSIEELEKT